MENRRIPGWAINATAGLTTLALAAFYSGEQRPINPTVPNIPSISARELQLKPQAYLPLVIAKGNEIAPTQLEPHIAGARWNPQQKSMEFFDKRTNEKLSCIGESFIILDWADGYHANFIPGIYDPVKTESDIKRMKDRGYTCTRVFINETQMIGQDGKPSKEYIKNFADFLQKAEKNNFFVVASFDPTFMQGYKKEDSVAEDMNWQFFTKEGLEDAKQRKNAFFETLKEFKAQTKVVLYWSMFNEVSVDKAKLPFTKSGPFNAPWGATYNLPGDSQKLKEDGMINYLSLVSDEIRRYDPTALVGTGIFNEKAVPPPDTRMVATAAILREAMVGGKLFGKVQVFPLHAYPVDVDPKFVVEAASFQETTIDKTKSFPEYNPYLVYLLEEYGVFKPGYVPLNVYSKEDAIKISLKWRTDACKYGVSNFIFWHMREQIDKTGKFTEGVYTGIDASGDDSIEKALAPKNSQVCPQENKPSSKVIYPQDFESQRITIWSEPKKPEPWQKNKSVLFHRKQAA